MGLPRRSGSASGRFAGSRRVHGARSVSALYGTLSVVVLVAALVMALIVRPPPPPSIAELGPSPQEQIEEARENQAAGSASGDIATAAEEEQARTAKQQKGSTTTTAAPSSTTTSAKKVPSTRRCFGDPPRQTEDPHSPPCVFEIFQGDNGGKTAPGVTSTEVQIVVGHPVPEDYVQALLSHFNNRYEFYGRRMEVVSYSAPPKNPSESKAAADEASSHDPFAAVTRYSGYDNKPYHTRLAAKQVNSIAVSPPNFNSDDVDDGLFWSTHPLLDHRGGAAGEFICGALNGRMAKHAGDDTYKDTSRKFAIVNTRFNFESNWSDVADLKSKLEGCRADFKEFKMVASEEGHANTINDLKHQGFTTVIHVGSISLFAPFAARANRLAYFPEWFNIGLVLEDNESNWSSAQAGAQAEAAFGIAPWARVRSADEMPACWALEEGGRRCDSSTYATAGLVEELYGGLLILASGIQMAGPNLTPQSFREALWDTVWPNPNPGGPPYWQQRVDFGPGDPVFYGDYSIWWWNENAAKKQVNPPTSGPGSFCYLNRGGRFLPGEFPVDADRRLFNEEPCR